MDNILPDNQTDFERAHETVNAERFDLLDVESIVRGKDPLLCAPSVLPLLAWERNVDLYYEDWSLAQKRSVVNNWYTYERLKGTPEGFRRFYDLVGARLVRATMPPQDFFAGDNWTETERLRFLSRFQQIRTYPYVPYVENWGVFEGNSFLDETHVSAIEIGVDTSIRITKLYDPLTNEETEITRREIVFTNFESTVYEYEEFAIPARRVGLYADGGFLDSRFITDDDASSRTIRAEIFRPNSIAIASVQLSTVMPDGDLINLRPELIRENFTDIGDFADFCYVSGNGYEMFAGQDIAWRFIYERLYLFDPSRHPESSAGDWGAYLDHARLGMGRRTAEMKVEAPGKMHPSDVSLFVDGYMLEDDRKVLERSKEATVSAMAAGDHVYLDILTKRERTLDDPIDMEEGFNIDGLVED